MGVAERKAREFANREQNILDAAMGLFLADDWQAVTIDVIADKAEIGKGTVYKHFRSKDEVYARLVLEYSRGLRKKLDRIDSSLGVGERVAAMIRVHWRNAMENPRLQELSDFCELADRNMNLRPEIAEELARHRQHVSNMAGELLWEGIQQGVFINTPVEYLRMIAWATLKGSWQIMRNGDSGLDPERYLEFLVDFLLGRISKPGQHESRLSAL